MIKEAQTIHLFRPEHDDDIADCVRYFNLEASNAARPGCAAAGGSPAQGGDAPGDPGPARPDRPGDRVHRPPTPRWRPPVSTPTRLSRAHSPVGTGQHYPALVTAAAAAGVLTVWHLALVSYRNARATESPYYR